MEKTKEVISLLFSRVDFVLIVVGAGIFGYHFFFATKDDVRAVHDDVHALELKLVQVEAKVDGLEAKVEALEVRVEALEARVEAGFDAMNQRLDDIIFFMRANSEQLRTNSKMMTGHLQNDHNKKP